MSSLFSSVFVFSESFSFAKNLIGIMKFSLRLLYQLFIWSLCGFSWSFHGVFIMRCPCTSILSCTDVQPGLNYNEQAVLFNCRLYLGKPRRKVQKVTLFTSVSQQLQCYISFHTRPTLPMCGRRAFDQFYAIK